VVNIAPRPLYPREKVFSTPSIDACWCDFALFCFRKVVRVVKAYKWSKGLAPHVLNLCARWSGQHRAPAALSPGKEHGFPLNKRLCWRQNRSRRYGEVSPPRRDWNLLRPARSRVAIPTTLSRLLSSAVLASYLSALSKDGGRIVVG